MSNYLIILVIGLLTPFAVSKPFYRRDFSYVEAYDAFYKVHWDVSGLSWSAAFKACYDEGAKLFYPTNKEEWTVVKTLATALPFMPNTTQMYVGLHDEFNLGEFVTIDGKATESPLDIKEKISSSERCLLMDFTTGAFVVDACTRGEEGPAAFVCKKVEEKVCPTIDREYKYVNDAKKCYKVNSRRKTWRSALETCFMEGGTLAMFDQGNRYGLNLKNEEHYFIGFRKMFDTNDFFTVKGVKLVDDEFEQSHNSNLDYGDCGVVDEGYRKDVVSCDRQLLFICEMDVINGVTA